MLLCFNYHPVYLAMCNGVLEYSVYRNIRRPYIQNASSIQLEVILKILFFVILFAFMMWCFYSHIYVTNIILTFYIILPFSLLIVVELIYGIVPIVEILEIVV